MLTDLESVFRSLKSELGLRPIFHHKEERTEGHLFITVLAYQFVQVIRRKLKSHGNKLVWASLRNILSVQQRVTATFKQKDGRTLNIRKATRAESDLQDIYKVLGISATPGGIKKLVV
jgi:transposase